MRVLFYISKQYSLPVIAPLQEYLRNTGETFAFFVSNKVLRELPESWKDRPVFQTVEEGIAFDPDLVIVPGNFVDYRLPGKKVQVFHGIGVEKPSHYEIRHFFHLYCTSGPVVTQAFERRRKQYGYFLVRETGWPKIDWILNYPREELRRRVDLPEDKRVILFAPTLSRKMESASDLLPVISRCFRKDRIWVVKFHELMSKDIKAMAGDFDPGQFRVVDVPDITPYLHAADVMVSDTSSVIYEFMVLDKPVITYRTASRTDKGIDITSPEELEPAIERALRDPGEHRDNRRRHLSEVNPYLDGRTSERLFRELRLIMDNDLWPEKRMPLNLFRRMQIRYHETYRKGYLR
ncbi:CDP-glycerol glycerophosphotransferase family protein [bacterium]|nr:CDP-glycerol glycerophosphotransferase family protein [bacterium]